MDFDYFETFTITLIFLSIFVGGIVKGSVGIGMSMFSVPIIAFILPPTKAMMLLCFLYCNEPNSNEYKTRNKQL